MSNIYINPCRIFRHKNPAKDAEGIGEGEVSISHLLTVKRKNAHGFTAWAQNGGSERIQTLFDLPEKEFVTADEFLRRKRDRAEENRRKYPYPVRTRQKQKTSLVQPERVEKRLRGL